MKRYFIAIVIALIIIAFVWQDFLLSNEGFSTITPLEAEQNYRYLHNEQVPREDISQLLVSNDQIVVYYDDVGIVNVYSWDGDYLYGIQIDSVKNGHGDMSFHNNLLYIDAKRIYVINNGMVVDVFTRSENYDAYKEAQTYMEGDPTTQIEGTTFYIIDKKL